MPGAGVACFAFKLGADAVPRAVTVGGDAGEEALRSEHARGYCPSMSRPGQSVSTSTRWRSIARASSCSTSIPTSPSSMPATSYLASKSFYHDPERLLAARQHSRGASTLLLDLLAAVRTRSLPTATVGEATRSGARLIRRIDAGGSP